jgi:hypothetical protein
LFQHEGGRLFTDSVVWTEVGDKGDHWLNAQVTITSPDPEKEVQVSIASGI